MSFWDDVKDFGEKVVTVVSAPVWAPAAGFGVLLDKTFPGNKYAGAVANTFEAPAAFVQGGKYSLTKLNAAVQQATPGLQLGAAVAGGPLGSAAGFDASGLSDASGILHDLTGSGANSGAKYNNPEGGVQKASPTPFVQPSNGMDWTPVIIAGGAGLVLLILLTRGKK